MKVLPYVVLWITSSMAPVALCDVVVQIDGASAGLNGRNMHLDGTFAGVVGDTIVLAGRKHRLSIGLVQGIDAVQEVEMVNGTIVSNSAATGDCVVRTYWALKDWQPASIKRLESLVVLTLARPNPVADGECENLPSNVRCVEKAAMVSVRSTPEIGADIWLNGKSLRTSTAAVLSVPYCVGTTPRKDFVLRKPGFANCGASIRVSDARNDYQVSCALLSIT